MCDRNVYIYNHAFQNMKDSRRRCKGFDEALDALLDSVSFKFHRKFFTIPKSEALKRMQDRHLI